MMGMVKIVENEEDYIPPIPHLPYYLQDGAHSHKYHWEAFEDRNGNKADLKVVRYVTKKGKDREAVIIVNWRT